MEADMVQPVHFAEKEIEAQKEGVTGPRSPIKREVNRKLNKESQVSCGRMKFTSALWDTQSSGSRDAQTGRKRDSGTHSSKCFVLHSIWANGCR